MSLDKLENRIKRIEKQSSIRKETIPPEDLIQVVESKDQQAAIIKDMRVEYPDADMDAMVFVGTGYPF